MGLKSWWNRFSSKFHKSSQYESYNINNANSQCESYNKSNEDSQCESYNRNNADGSSSIDGLNFSSLLESINVIYSSSCLYDKEFESHLQQGSGIEENYAKNHGESSNELVTPTRELENIDKQTNETYPILNKNKIRTEVMNICEEGTKTQESVVENTLIPDEEFELKLKEKFHLQQQQ
ncbi:uncharacterized protein LOC111641944 [Centruroides sculpturatus]|uniref:uncharacterized protein LOC111641944 n=1 Tax=Centruroides sculpturatus TaxID=218467 RepID=UPI000C6DAD83|nr:uncharacterized protein LOC111641944 [Centruroides sculpturatus]